MGFNFKSDYSILKTQEIDLYDKNIKLGIEFCGNYWHTELSPQPRDKNYHYNKYLKCLKEDTRLITIFKDEWKLKQNKCKNIIKSILNIQKRIFARKCRLEQTNRQIFNKFCDNFHLQGSNNLGLVFFTLNYENEIVASMSLGRHHRKKDALILDRFCCRDNISVIGGASKLFKQCKLWAKQNNYEKITSWSDNRWSQGNIYNTLGFELEEELSPDYSYVNLKKPIERLSKQSQKKSNTGCPKDITEREWAVQHDLARIWDCGKKRWVFYL